MADIEQEYQDRVRTTLHDLIERRRSSKSVSSSAGGPAKKIYTEPNSLHDENIQPVPVLHSKGTIGQTVTSRYLEEDPRLKAGFREVMSLFVHSTTFTTFIFVVICLNTLLLVTQTFEAVAVRADWYFTIIDSVFLGIYIIEMVLKIYVLRQDYPKDYWNILDLAIVIVNILDFILPLIVKSVASGQLAALDILKLFRIFRAIRALRVLRAIRFLTNLQVIMNTCLQSMHSMGAIVGLMLLFMYMFAVVGRGLYAHADPQRFGTLWLSLFTLFQLLTLDDWFFIYEDVVKADPSSGHIIIYLILYIVIEFLIFLNLFVAVLVDNFQLTLYAAHSEAKEKKAIKSKVKLEGEDDYDDFESDDDMSFGGHRKLDKKRMLMTDVYPDASDEERAALACYFLTLASLEYNMYLYQQQQHTLNLIVDLCSDQSEEF